MPDRISSFSTGLFLLLSLFLALLLPVLFSVLSKAQAVERQIVCSTPLHNPQVFPSLQAAQESGAAGENGEPDPRYSLHNGERLTALHVRALIIQTNGPRLLQGRLFDERGRQAWLEDTTGGQRHDILFVPAYEWRCED